MSTQAVSKSEVRKQAQRERVLSAALICFVRYGFHNASMANIAETAQMSAGLIYRYFENKNAIILAIIEAQLEITRERIRELRSTDDLADGMIEYFESQDCGDPESMSAALFLEMSAEATRDADIRRAVERFDTVVRQGLMDWLSRPIDQGGHGLGAETARVRAVAMTLLIEGMKARRAREPDIDRADLRAAVEAIVETITRPEAE
ncbi:TetR/AcrR family transcriptional regulator [Marinihelvus fidelis]|uniref:TetR/AcrR family transcriptional regulator n=1 Tax=Marinihelvus fidelis TaxID=2613842 RepID=A0A5N0TCG3_9GAMM|nr:TetR/AcrR family transcriptional regulator [Marinihelvus fidelis]KAA9132722.1 TetR/AcrR family transcriptional regulator [Marinihelvus fidelis]